MRRAGGNHIGVDIDKPAVISHQRGVGNADAVEIGRFRYIDGRHGAAFPVAHSEIIGSAHPVFGAGRNGFGNADDSNGNILRFVAGKDHQPRLFAHLPAQQPRRVQPQDALNAGAAAVVCRYGCGGPPAGHQPRVLREPGNEKGPAQRNINHAIRRARLRQRQRRRHLGVAVAEPLQIADFGVNSALNIGAQGGVVLRPQRAVANNNLRVDDRGRRNRQGVPQPGLRQRLGVHRAQGHYGDGGQDAESGNGQQPPSRTHPPGQQPEQQGKVGHCGRRRCRSRDAVQSDGTLRYAVISAAMRSRSRGSSVSAARRHSST